MQQAIDFEIRWQIEQLEDGKVIEQATVLFDPESGETRAMRTKEDAADYRYFPDPDLPPLVIASQWIDEIRGSMPELPRAMEQRFVSTYGLPEYDATTLTQSQQMASYFEATVAACGQAKLASNWIMGELSRRLNEADLEIDNCPVSAQILAELISTIANGEISNNSGKIILDALWTDSSTKISAFIESKGLKQVNDSGALERLIDEVLAANADNVAQFKAGKEKAFNALIGQAMKASKGQANPQQLTELLKKKLA